MLETLQYILPGLRVTLTVTLIALGMGFILGTFTAVLRVYGGPVASLAAAAYSTIVRALPVVVIIFILYFVITAFVDLDPFFSGAIALGITSGAYQAELFRGAILSVPSNQVTAARAIGMSRWVAIRTIVLPQAFRLAIPAWSNEVTLVLKDSSLVFVIGVPEILRRAQYVGARTFEPLLAFGTVALIYLTLTFLATKGLALLENRYKLSL
ncbi:amino acid ABC transporter permease [Desulfovibrio caledoniensis]|jgi:polar amino acid transport system permease protein